MFTPQITPEFVARALNLKFPPNSLSSSDQPFSAVITDSRKIKPGCLFIALKGDTFDGHAFIGTAIKQGAKGVLCNRGSEILDSASALLFQVDDTVSAFRKIAHAWRREFSIPLIAVAGSVGKTTTKEILTSVLRGKYSNVLKTQGSQNGFIGIPMTLMDLRPEHQAAVIEVGIDEIGAMKQHMELVAATASVLTTIGPEHLEKLRDIPTVAQEEGLALSAVAQTGGLVAINMDDPWIRPHSKTLRLGTKLTYGLSESDVDLKGSYDPVTGTLEVQGSCYPVPLPGIHNAGNTLAAIAIATGIGLTPDEITQGLKTFKPVDGRSEVRELGRGESKIKVICDYYNANPTSTEAGLVLLSQLAGRSKRFACLADMLELGVEEEKFHRDLATVIIAEKIEHVFLFGSRMKALQDELKKKNFTQDVRHFDDQSALSTSLINEIKPGETVLIKGSHSMKMERVFESLKDSLTK
jgi:UDP-N-acetylmuramoyl-tripeptide--D-alanyl-D-alanine ligase